MYRCNRCPKGGEHRRSPGSLGPSGAGRSPAQRTKDRAPCAYLSCLLHEHLIRHPFGMPPSPERGRCSVVHTSKGTRCQSLKTSYLPHEHLIRHGFAVPPSPGRGRCSAAHTSKEARYQSHQPSCLQHEHLIRQALRPATFSRSLNRRLWHCRAKSLFRSPLPFANAFGVVPTGHPLISSVWKGKVPCCAHFQSCATPTAPEGASALSAPGG